MGEWAVLGVLVERPRHGFAVAAELAPGTELGSAWTVRRPLVYRAVEHLLELRLARLSKEEPGSAGPRRRVVAPTAAGQRRLRAWLDEPVVDALRSAPEDIVGRWRRATAAAVEGFLAELERT